MIKQRRARQVGLEFVHGFHPPGNLASLTHVPIDRHHHDLSLGYRRYVGRWCGQRSRVPAMPRPTFRCA